MAIDKNSIIRRQLEALDGMELTRLREKFQEYYGLETTSRNADSLRRRIAYRMQEYQLGGLSAEDEALLEDMADNDSLAMLVNAPAPKARKNEGTRYRREWHGRTYEVILRSEGKYEMDGNIYSSLSAVAYAITGTHWNGKLFFGVKS